MKLSATLSIASILAIALMCHECLAQSVSDSASKKEASHLTQPVLFRGNQFTTVVPGGWVVSFPNNSTRFQIGKLNKLKPTYKAVIRLDVGRPAGDLASTVKRLRERFNMKEIDASFDWAGQKAVVLKGETKGVATPERVFCTIRNEKIFMLFVALDSDINVDAEVNYILEKWSWDRE